MGDINEFLKKKIKVEIYQVENIQIHYKMVTWHYIFHKYLLYKIMKFE